MSAEAGPIRILSVEQLLLFLKSFSTQLRVKNQPSMVCFKQLCSQFIGAILRS